MSENRGAGTFMTNVGGSQGRTGAGYLFTLRFGGLGRLFNYIS